jgi:excisionase family DNA binding protein
MPDAFSNPPVAGDEDPWLTVPQVSAELKIHPATVRIWIKTGRLRAVRVGREWRVRRSEVNRTLMSDASPAYGQEHGTSDPGRAAGPTPAPRQIADHIMTVTAAPGAES